MAAQKQDNQIERTFSSYVRIQAVVLKTYLGRWTIGRSGERGSGISVLPARYDDDDDDVQKISSQNCCLQISPRNFIPYIEGWSGKYFKHMVSSKKLLPLWWCFIKKRKQWFAHLMRHGFLKYCHWNFCKINISTMFVYNLPKTFNIDRSNKRKWVFARKNSRRRYPAETLADTYVADHKTLFANTPAEVESLLHSLKQAAGNISLHRNANKTEYMRFNREGTISILSGMYMKFVEKTRT